MRKLEKCKRLALVSAAYMLHGAKKLGGTVRQHSARVIALLLAVAMLVSLMPMQASAETPQYVTVTSKKGTVVDGYIAAVNGHMAYRENSSTKIDIVGYYNEKWIQTTYELGGYDVAQKGFKESVVDYTASPVSGGRYIRLTLNVTAGSSGVTNGKLAIYADTMIGDNDKAAIEVIKSGNDIIGLKMIDSKSGAQLSLFFANAPGVTAVDTYWFGRYGERSAKCYNQLDESSKSSSGTYNSDLTSYSDADSAFAVSWQNINLNPGQKAAYSIIVGVGEVADPVEWYDTGLTLDRDTVPLGKNVNVTASVKDRAGLTEELYVTVDESSEEILLGSFSSGTGIAAETFTLDSADLGKGDHTLTFWVMNQEGAMTPLITKNITVTDPIPPATLDDPVAQNSIAYGAKLSNVGLPAGWTWAEPNTVPPINNSGYVAYYTPADTENYDWTGVAGWDETTKRVARTVAVTVNKANVTYTAPAANADLVYSGAAQTLISAGSATGGAMQYALGTATEVTGSWGTTLPSATAAGTYYVWYKVVGDENHNDVAPTFVASTINKADATCIAPTANSGLIYSGAAQTLISAGSATGGTMQYALGTATEATGSWGSTLPSATAAGTYYVWYKVVGDENHNDVAPAKVAVNINKANVTYTAPTANAGLIYSGAAQTLISAGSATGGTMQYALGTATEVTGSWGTSLPSATAAGTYYVWYKVVGDANHNDVAPAFVAVTVEQKEVTLTWSTLSGQLTYNGKAYVLTAKLGGIVDGDSCTVTVATVGSNVNAGTFCYRATALSNANYKLPANADSRSYTIAKKDITVAMVNCEIYVGGWPEYSYTVEGLLDGDELIAGPGYGTSADLKKPGVYTVYLDGADAGPNYSVTHVEGKLTVKEAAADAKPTYSVTVGNVVNGNVTASVKTATAGDTVTLTLAPINGYKLGTLSAAAGGNAVALTRVSDTVYSFTMPAANVTVGAVFVKASSSVAGCGGDEACPMTEYTDLDAEKWYHDGVHYCIENGLMIGDDNGNFAPEAALTRAALVSILWRMEGEPKVDHKLTFKDVAADAWYAEAIAWANSVGIVNGYSNNKFGPNDEITREQMAAILYRYADYKGELDAIDDDAAKDFSDWKNVSKWAEAAVAWACDEGLISGIEEGNKVTLAPEGTASRAQIASVIYRYIANI